MLLFNILYSKIHVFLSLSHAHTQLVFSVRLVFNMIATKVKNVHEMYHKVQF